MKSVLKSTIRSTKDCWEHLELEGELVKHQGVGWEEAWALKNWVCMTLCSLEYPAVGRAVVEESSRTSHWFSICLLFVFNTNSYQSFIWSLYKLKVWIYKLFHIFFFLFSQKRAWISGNPANDGPRGLEFSLSLLLSVPSCACVNDCVHCNRLAICPGIVNPC